MPRPGKPNAGRSRGLPQLTIRLSEAERTELLRRAQACHLSASEYVRRACLAEWVEPGGLRVLPPWSHGRSSGPEW